MNPNKSPNKTGKSPLINLLTDKSQKFPNRPVLVPPVLQQVGKLAAGVANVSTELSSSSSATGKLILKQYQLLISNVQMLN